MKRMLEKNSNGSIDILDDWGRILYRVENDETGIVALLAKKLCDYENAFDKENLFNTLRGYFDNTGEDIAEITDFIIANSFE